MGVKGLNIFIIKFEKNVMERIEMRKKIEDWTDHHGSPPQILIDLKEIAHNFVQTDEIGLILGGRYDYYNKMLSMFLDNLKKTGAKLVFFMPGKKYTDDLPFFIPKSEDNYAESLKILDEIEKNSNRNSLQEMLKAKNKYSSDIRMELSFNYNLKKLVHRFTNVNDVHTNHIRHNQEIARYANEHADEVLAVISNDTDFLAFEGEFEYWRANGINYKQLTALQYDKQKLHERFDFELGAFQMQLLSALCGSNFLPVYTIRDWIDRLEESNNDPLVRGKILNVAAYVKCQEPIDHDEKGKPIFDFEKISRDVFGEKFSEAQKNAITNCYASYNLDFEEEMSNSGYQDPAQRDSFLKFCKSHDLFLYKLATDDVFNVKDITFMDFRNFKSKSYAELVIPILMKICGILNKDARRRPNVRSICMKHAHDEPFKQTEETIIYPPSSMSLPPLFDLIFKNKERKYDRDRWPLFEWILDLDEGFLQQLRAKIDIQRFFACIVTLHYLVQQEELTAKEASAILFTEHKMRTQISNQTEYPLELNVKFIRIAHLYVKMYVLISHCLDVCGLHEMTDLIKFDGPIFHRQMEKFEKATDEEMQRFVSSTKPIWVF